MNKFRRFAINVWGINADGKTDRQIADEGLNALEDWMREIGVVMNLTELGATKDMVGDMADSTFILTAGYKVLTRNEVAQVFMDSL